MSIKLLAEKLSDRWWRVQNLYFIQDAEGHKVKFKPNWAQTHFYRNIWYFNTILKARQLGFSTFILIYILDAILFNKDKTAGIIAQSLDDAQKLFKRVKFAYDNLPEDIKRMIPAVQDSAKSLAFGNGSSISVGTSLRGGTIQYLHISEYGKIAAKYPEKAREIKTGALNTVHAGQQIFIESTAEGQEGEFYELCQRAEALQQMDKPLTPLDPKFHFYPWYLNTSYELEQEVTITAELEKYFDQVEAENSIMLSDEQKYWYAKKSESMGDDMKREFPSTPKESFEQSVEGTYFAKEMADARKQGRICRVPWDPAKPVFTFWDLGYNDDNAITFVQEDGEGLNAIDYYENSLEGLPHYIKVLKDKPYTYAEHDWPHDGINTDWSTGVKRNVMAAKLGLKPIKIIERSKDLRDDHEAVRNILPKMRFDVNNCAKLIKHISSYRKEWNEKLGVWRDAPRHDESSHGVSTIRTLAVGYKKSKPARTKEPDEAGWENW